jgi:flagellar basal body-associated protein FliL
MVVAPEDIDRHLAAQEPAPEKRRRRFLPLLALLVLAIVAAAIVYVLVHFS